MVRPNFERDCYLHLEMGNVDRISVRCCGRVAEVGELFTNQETRELVMLPQFGNSFKTYLENKKTGIVFAILTVNPRLFKLE